MEEQILALLSTRSKNRLFRYPKLNKRGKWPLPYRPEAKTIQRIAIQLGASEVAIREAIKAMRRKKLQEYGFSDWMLDL